MSDKVTRERMLGLLADLERISRISWSPETLNILYAIRALIEHGPEVDEAFVEKWTKKFRWIEDGFKYHPGWGYTKNLVREMLAEIPVTVKEGK